MNDYIVRATAADGQVRAFAATTKELVEAAQIEFALGKADNPHDMQIAAKKALTALQYTTAVRDKMLDAYKEIMNMQI